MNLPSGHTLQNGKYRITSVIGQGGFGITYKGVWLTEVKGPLGTIKTEVPVCIKEYFFKDYCYREADSFQVKVHSDMGKALFERFKEKQIKESKILSEVQHPYIVNVLEAFEENNTAYIAMEYISGYSLKYYLDREGVLPEGHVLHYIRQVGEALQFIHEKSILHLDIKPSNILIDVEGNARLIDFGVSKRYDIEQRETSTTTLTLSKGFAAIEQYDSEGIQSFTPCPDVYSLGASMYNLLTGVIPAESILRVTRPLKKPSELNPSISSTTEKVILKAMQVVPEERYQSVSEMIEALDFSKEDKAPILHVGEESVEETDDSTSVVDDEDTIVDHSDTKIVEDVRIHQRKVHIRKRNKAILKYSMLTLVLTGGLVGTVWMRSAGNNEELRKINTPQPSAGNSLGIAQKTEVNGKDTDQEAVHEEEVVTVEEDALGEVYKKAESDVKHPEKVQKTTAEKKTTKAQAKTVTEPVKKAVKVKPSEKEVKAENPSAEEEKQQPMPVKDNKADIEKQYDALYQSGLQKMNAGDFKGAKADFEKAKDIKLTEEVVRLQIKCDTQLAEQQVLERKNLYEIKRSFGQLTIVRKKGTGRYGAINDKAVEIIPCKYLNIGITDKGRAFEREDGLFDIYNIKGELVNAGSTYY